MPVVHAIMLNWNSFDLNDACIRSLRQSNLPFEKIVVVDNGSTDGSLQRLRETYSDEQVVFVCNDRNYGFAGGMNIGIRHASALGAEMLFTINNDTIIDPDCLSHLVNSLDGCPSAGIAGPAIMYYGRPEKIWQAGGYFSHIRAGIVVPSKGKSIHDIGIETCEVTFLTGCALLTRTTVIERVGMLDTSYFFYGEDVDYALRVKQSGFRMLFVPQARIWHKIDDVATDRTSPYVLYHLARSTIMIFRKRFSFPYRSYGILLQVLVYTPFRFWQILRGGSGLASCWGWIRGIIDGLVNENLNVKQNTLN